MIVKATFTFTFEPDTSDIDEKFVDKKGLALDLTQNELAYMLDHKEIDIRDFNFEIIDDDNNHEI